MLEWNLLPLPLLVPAHLRVSPGLALVAFACLFLEGGRLRCSLVLREGLQLDFPISCDLGGG